MGDAGNSALSISISLSICVGIVTTVLVCDVQWPVRNDDARLRESAENVPRRARYIGRSMRRAPDPSCVRRRPHRTCLPGHGSRRNQVDCRVPALVRKRGGCGRALWTRRGARAAGGPLDHDFAWSLDSPACSTHALPLSRGARAPFLGSSTAEHPAVNRRVVGSNPTRGAIFEGPRNSQSCGGFSLVWRGSRVPPRVLVPARRPGLARGPS